MIIFNGFLSGSAEKRLHKKNSDFGRNCALVAIILFFPIILFICIETQIWLISILYVLLFLAIPLLSKIPQSEKEKKMVTPKQIIIDEKNMVCKTNKFEEIRYIQDVKIVNDYGDFYELIFPFGKISNNFICQKKLISNGTIEEFESLFSGKIKRHSK